MIPTPIAGQRQLISALDALLVAEVSSFPWPNLDPDLPYRHRQGRRDNAGDDQRDQRPQWSRSGGRRHVQHLH
jgi:hypothetical protein